MATPIRFSRRIVFAALGVLFSSSCTSTATGGIYVASLADPEPRLVGSPAGLPVWSPDGQDLIWSTEQGIQTWNVVSGERGQLTSDVVAGWPSYSPDGDQIAYLLLSAPELVLFNTLTRTVSARFDARAPGTTPVNSRMRFIGGPSWSPDGQQLAFPCWDGAGDEICVMDLTSGQVTQLTMLSQELSGRTNAGERPQATSNVGAPAWSPDGAMIAVAAYPERRGAASGLFVIDVLKGSAQRLSDLQPNSKITWVADSSAVLFSAPSGARNDVVRAGIGGQAPVNVTASQPGSFRNPAILANGDVIAANSEGAIVVVRDEREVGRILVGGLFADYPAPQPEGDLFSFEARPELIQNYQAT